MVFGGGPIIILVFSQLSQFCFYDHLLMESKKMRKFQDVLQFVDNFISKMLLNI